MNNSFMGTGDQVLRRRRVAGLLDALFGEAWERERRRRRRSLLILVIMAVLVAIALTALTTGVRRNLPKHVPAAATAMPNRHLVSSTALPTAEHYSSLAYLGGHLIVWGGGHDSMQSVPAATTQHVGATALGTCNVALVDPASLRITATRRGNCGDPQLYGERVLPVEQFAAGGKSGLMERIRIAVMSDTAPLGYRLGPVIVTNQECSDCNATWIDGAGSLWIYAPATVGDTRYDLFRVSQRTGAVLQSWWVPANDDPVMAVNDDGLWLAPSLSSGVPTRPSRGTERDYASLWLIAPGAHAPRRVLTVGDSGAEWVVGTRRSLWIAVPAPKGRTSTIWQVSGSDAHVARTTHHVRGARQCAQLGGGPSQIGVSSAAGVDCVGIDGSVFRFNPRTGAGAHIVTVARPQDDVAPAAMIGRAFLFIANNRIYRVTDQQRR